MLRYRNGARGLLWASQVAPGNENNLRLRVYGSKGGLDWHQEQPNQLHWSPFGQPTQTLGRGTGAANAAAARVSRIPSGHPEGYLEGFATLYAEIAQAIRAARPGGPKADKAAHFPTLRRRAEGRRVHRGGGQVVGPRRALGAAAALTWDGVRRRGLRRGSHRCGEGAVHRHHQATHVRGLVGGQEHGCRTDFGQPCPSGRPACAGTTQSLKALFSISAVFISVAKNPGAMQLAVMPSAASSTASCRVSAWTAPLLAT